MQNSTTQQSQQFSLPKTEGYGLSEFQSKSEFTLLMYFRNGYTRGMKFHSFKQENRKIAGEYIKDHRYAFNRLMYIVEELHKDKYKTAIIYHNPTGIEVCKYSYGTCKDRIPLNWETKENGDIVFVMKDQKAKNLQARMLKLQDSNFYKY